jgi:predicted metal-dependent HD superfamily phosphohydrolase
MIERDDTALRQRWDDLWRRIGLADERVPAIDPLLMACSLPVRHYHNLGHIDQCLRELDGIRELCESVDAVELAIWFHDAVYDPTRADNEERSADVAAEAMNATGVGPTAVQEVVEMILATKHNRASASGDAAVLLDIDLSILGQPPAVFDVYEQAIRCEYAFVDQKDFNRGRANILRRFLDRKTIYSTHYMQTRYEAQARQNLLRSIARLEGDH